MDTQNTVSIAADQNAVIQGTKDQPTNLNASTVTTEPSFSASNEAKTEVQPQIASEIKSDNIVNPEQIELSKTVPTVAEGKIIQQPDEKTQLTNDEVVAVVQVVSKPIQGEVVTQQEKQLGRPSKFNEGMIQKAKDYLAECMIGTEIVNKKGEKVRTKKLPLIEELARLCGVDGDTIVEWCSKNEDFSAAIKAIKNLQKERIILKGFSASNPTFSIFMLKANHGMMETEKQVLIADRDVKVSITRE